MKKIFCFLIFFINMLCLVVSGEASDNRITPTVKAVAKVLPSVVNIGTERIVTAYDSPWGSHDPFERMFRDFYSRQMNRKETSLGSGAIINQEGLIVTNAHVVHKATKILITNAEGKQYLAQEIAADDLNDIALLRLIDYPEKSPLIPISCAQPDQLLLGETVIAVGNPYGLGSTVSKGIISAIGRKVTYSGKVIFNDILQTDAPINPGNSGGPLVNINGEMVGLNTAVYQQADGIGFAIPLKRIEQVIAGWLIPERFAEVSLGIIPTEKHEDGKTVFYLKNVIPDSPAWEAGLRQGNEIYSFNGNKLNSLMDLSNTLWKLKAGGKLQLGIKGKGNVKLTVKALQSLDSKKLAEQKLGLGLQQLTLKLAKTLGYPFHGGLIINEISSNHSSLRRGDILVRIGDVPVYDYKDLRRALNGKLYGDKITALVIFVLIKNGKMQIYKRNVILKIN